PHSLPAGEDLVERPADDLVTRDPGDRLGRPVPEPDDAVRVDEEDAVADRLEHARGLCTPCDLAIELCVLDRGAHAARELFCEREVLRPVTAARLGGDERDDAQQLAMRDERNTDVALHAELAHETEVEVVLRQLGELLVADLGGELAATSTEDERRALHGLGILGIPACELE